MNTAKRQVTAEEVKKHLADGSWLVVPAPTMDLLLDHNRRLSEMLGTFVTEAASLLDELNQERENMYRYHEEAFGPDEPSGAGEVGPTIVDGKP